MLVGTRGQLVFVVHAIVGGLLVEVADVVAVLGFATADSLEHFDLTSHQKATCGGAFGVDDGLVLAHG